MHGNEQSYLEAFDELSSAPGITVADASVYGKHRYVETVREFPDILQFSQKQFLFLFRVDVRTELGTMDEASLIIVGQEAGIPVVQVACMEDEASVRFDDP